ncbi:MAG: FecR domain-containing protein [Candidatus Pseudobacter hemicellulosilyticus]|uniref:FecR domain-containing protein n=1 Tax=Candidatus Pseudobacter hemicellulosilyticus TaxID=3121375 RepID=A0AAJ5X1K2_9BACT|nr:MAG: FecR domain-containing protein [Pseudobacter sp.]
MFFLQRTSQPAPEKWTTIYADGHSLRKFYLPDSTQVTLDANSSLSYSSGYNMANRTVTLTGQARFEVHRDSLRPFIVDAGGVATRALGTVFNVENRPEEGEIRVALTEGKVAVTTAANRNNPDVLLPGQILLYKPATQQTRKADFSNDAYAWINGGLSFYSMPLADVLEKISKKYGLQIKYDKNRLTGKSVTASFDRADWRQMLDNLLYLHDIHYTVKNNVITLRY